MHELGARKCNKIRENEADTDGEQELEDYDVSPGTQCPLTMKTSILNSDFFN